MYKNSEKNLVKLEKIADELGVREYADGVLGNNSFSLWSGSSKPHQHHYGKGGLIQHTREVVELILQNRKYFKDTLNHEINEKECFLAALFHDIGKTWDYEPTDGDYNEWKGTTHKRKIHHISRSALIWNETCVSIHNNGGCSYGIFDEDEILHAILAHHGQREWGSPVAPATGLAWLLHLCDGLSARINDYKTFDRF